MSRRVNDLAFADDIALLENENIRAQRQLEALKNEASKVCLEINDSKTVQLRLNQPENQTQQQPNLHIDGKAIDIVDDFKYLGSYVVNIEKDINNRIASTRTCYRIILGVRQFEAHTTNK